MFKKKTPKFFCDNCSAEVPVNAKNCPGCGRFFSSVRCPACGFSGEEALFLKGCPKCGYSAIPGRDKKQSKRNINIKKTNVRSEPLPFWLYMLAAALFTIVITALIFTIL